MIPVFRPLLPSLDSLSPYLKRIDESRYYSNFGPLESELRERFGAHCGVNSDRIVTVANATLGLMIAIISLKLPPGSICIVPSWTFAATANAIKLAGLEVCFTDVEPDSWEISPTRIRALIKLYGKRLRCVVPVSPFGRPVEESPWVEFQAETGVKVVFDCAGAIDNQRVENVVTVFSLHATKLISAAEGGFIVASSADEADKLRHLTYQVFVSE